MKITAMQSLRLALAALVLLGVSARVHAQGTDFSKIEIKTTKITPNFYELEGSGGNIGVLAGPDGVFLVDGEFAPLTTKIVAAIRQFSDAPIRFLVNTHVHGDHTGGNENFGKMGVTILSRDALRDRLMHPAPGANGNTAPGAPAAALPVITYDNPVTIHMDGEDIRLIPIVKAHTDGDTMIFFPNNDVIMTGDFFRTVGYPYFDRGNGGSLQGVIDALNLEYKMAGPNTKIIPGHGAPADRNALIAQRDMIIALRDRVAAMMKQGKTSDEVVAAHLTADYDAKIVEPGTTADRFISGVYAELKAGK